MDGNESRQLPAVESLVSRIQVVQSSPWFVSEVSSYTTGNKEARFNPRPETIVCDSTKVLEGKTECVSGFLIRNTLEYANAV